jgi:putative endonuclease
VTTTVSLGASAEDLAARALSRAGYAIVERNFRCAAGELDIIARDRDVLVFVEVRSRADGSHGHAAEMVSRRKQRQVARIALCYVGLRDPVFERSRFDVVAITGGEVEVIRDAWRL